MVDEGIDQILANIVNNHPVDEDVDQIWPNMVNNYPAVCSMK